MKEKLFSRVDDFCRNGKIGSLDFEAVIVAFSGGADSALLLDYIVSRFSDKTVCTAHLNHMIRGEEALRDLKFCRSVSEKYSIRFFEESVDIPALEKEQHMGTEECARQARYTFFDKCINTVSKEYSIPKNKILVATAHNADDNAETVLINLTRGTALRGLSGIPQVRGCYIRPFLCLGSEEIRQCCESEKIPFVVDSTNETELYTRNKIRHGVTPVLREINPSFERAVLRCTKNIAKDADYLDSLALKALSPFEKETSAPRAHLAKMDFVIMSRAVACLYSNITDEAVSDHHIEKVCELILKSGDCEYCLPGGVRVVIGDKVSFTKNARPEKKVINYETVLEKGVETGTELGFILSFCDINSVSLENNPNVYNLLINTALINDKIKGTVIIRNRREGDTYRIGGMTKKVKKLFCDKKVPKSIRDILPVVCDEEGIVWIPGFPVRDDLRVKDKEEAKYILTYKKAEET